jgi:hypothetical protein
VLVVDNALAPAYWDVNWLQPWSCGYNADPAKGPVYQGQVNYEGVNWWEYESQNALILNYYPNKSDM